MFGALLKLNSAFESLSVKEVYHQLFLDKDFTDFIIELNTITQLYDQGIDSTGQSIGEYSPYTKILKTEKGQPIDRVTLKDTGAFYESFRTYWLDQGEGAIQIKANSIKEDGKDLLVEWGKDILGLDEDSLSQLRYIAEKKIIKIIREQLKKAA